MAEVGGWDRLQDLFDRAFDLPAPDRTAFLERACPDDPTLRAEIEALLAEHEQAPDFLEEPISRVADVLGAVMPEESSIGPYRLVRVLGTGGMGEVFLGEDQREDLRRPVAVKVIRRDLDSAEMLRRFRQERRILATLRHPNIAQLLDGGATADERPFVVMEYVEGEPIDAYCAARALSVEERLRLFLPVCDAVQHAHRNLVVHRDLKPANVLVTGEGLPKLMDFGIAELVDPDRELEAEPAAEPGARLLTPGYASPEQLRGDVAGVASDVYQLGLLLHEVLTGRRARGSSRTEEDPDTRVTPPSQAVEGRLRGRLAGDLDAIVLRAAEAEPERRYASAAALADDLRRHLSGFPVQARPATLGYRATRFAGRNRYAVAAAGVVAVALAAAATYSLEQARQVALERDRAVEVQAFLLETFGATGPDQAAGDSVTARQLLDRQAEALATTYLERPRLRALMMFVLAEGYDRLGLGEAAEPLAREALALRRETLGAANAETAESAAFLGWILHQAKQPEEAERLLREARATLERVRPRDPRKLSRTLNDLGVVREAAGAYAEAEELYRRSLALRRAQGPDARRAYATTASNLSVILYRQGDYRGAVTAGDEALVSMRASVGPDHQRSVIIQSNLAAMKLALGDMAGAESEYRDLLDRQTRLQGRAHPVTLRVLTSLGSTLISQLRWAEAEAVFGEALAIMEARSGPDHPDVAPTRLRLAQAIMRQGRAQEALPMVVRSLAVERATLGEGHPRLARDTETLADALGLLGRTAEAERTHRDALAVMDEKLGEDHPETATMRLRFGHRLLVMARPADAEAELTRAEHALAERLPEGHVSVIGARLRLAQALLALGEPTRADSLLALARAGIEATHPIPDLMALHDSLAAVLTAAR